MIHLINHPDAKVIEIRSNRKGFWMAFQKGWGISVHWDSGNYCDGSGRDAEIAVLKPGDRSAGRIGGGLLSMRRRYDEEGNLTSESKSIGLHDDVIGYRKDYEVLKAMQIVSEFESDLSDVDAIDMFVSRFYNDKEVTA